MGFENLDKIFKCKILNSRPGLWWVCYFRNTQLFSAATVQFMFSTHWSTKQHFNLHVSCELVQKSSHSRRTRCFSVSLKLEVWRDSVLWLSSDQSVSKDYASAEQIKFFLTCFPENWLSELFQESNMTLKNNQAIKR